MRLIFDAVGQGGRALNHVEATLVEGGGRITGARLEDRLDGSRAEVTATVTVHATGVWAGAAPGAPLLRPLRGSHLVFARETVPLRNGLAWLHPRDRRPVFAMSGKGRCWSARPTSTIRALEAPATISPAEAEYLVEALRLPFPQLRLDAAQALSAFAGLRAIVVPPGEALAAVGDGPRFGALDAARPGRHHRRQADDASCYRRRGAARGRTPGSAPRARAGAVARPRRDATARAAGRRRRGLGRGATSRGTGTARRNALCPGRAALGDARGAGAPPRRPADAPHPASAWWRRAAPRRCCRCSRQRAARTSAGTRRVGPTKPRAISSIGPRGMRHPQRICARERRPAARDRRRHAERARPRLRPRRDDARSLAIAVRAALRLAAAGLGGEGRGGLRTGRALPRPVAPSGSRATWPPSGSPAWPSRRSAAPWSARADDGTPLRPAIVWPDQRLATTPPPLGLLWTTLFGLAGAGELIRQLQRQAECNWLAQHEPDLWSKCERSPCCPAG